MCDLLLHYQAEALTLKVSSANRVVRRQLALCVDSCTCGEAGKGRFHSSSFAIGLLQGMHAVYTEDKSNKFPQHVCQKRPDWKVTLQSLSLLADGIVVDAEADVDALGPHNFEVSENCQNKRLPATKVRSVCYLGGSITEQKSGWRPRIHLWLQRHLGRSLKAVNAFCGNAGSTLLAFTVRDWVLSAAPDLIFIEVAINDGDALLEAGGDPEKERTIRLALEGIVRLIRTELPSSRIVFVEMFLRDDLPSKARSGTRAWVDADDAGATAVIYHSSVVEMHRRVAHAYGADLVDLVPTFANMDASNRGRYFRDDCHHSDAGAALVAAAVADSLIPILRLENALAARLPTPLDLDYWRPKRAELFDPGRLRPGHLKAHRAVADRCPLSGQPADWLWIHPSDAIDCQFEGRALALFTYVGPDSGRLLVSVDGKPPHVVDLVDQWCYYWRFTIVQAWAGPIGKHTALIQVDNTPPDRARLKRPITDANYLRHPDYGRTPKAWLRWYAPLA